ncbi:hypothetical protein AB1K70_02195 [Bremerella sp. JC770]|uniref:hypothetical protein n=1 Tax=Bremerella sp. JC770 TaxID=3232137 RepID=UPI003458076D
MGISRHIWIGYAVGLLLMLPIIPFLGILAWEGVPTNSSSPGGFGADMRMAYLMILGGPFVVIGALIVVVTTIAWAFHSRKKV